MALKNILIVGLGNSNSAYENTYHNAGFLFVDWLAKVHETTLKTNKRIPAKLASIISEEPPYHALLAQPTGYMNVSGMPVGKLTRHAGAAASDTYIAHDDSDLKLGTFKISSGQGGGGHHGVESVIGHLKTKDFNRIRIGIRKKEAPTARRIQAGDFVLKKISPADNKVLRETFVQINQRLTSHIAK